jgi:hypothetical protein
MLLQLGVLRFGFVGVIGGGQQESAGETHNPIIEIAIYIINLQSQQPVKSGT